MKFLQLCHLKYHERIHTWEKPYCSSNFKRKFSWSCNFKVHKGSHTSNKPFSCLYCDKKFYLTSNLKFHEWLKQVRSNWAAHIVTRNFHNKNFQNSWKNPYWWEVIQLFFDKTFSHSSLLKGHESRHWGKAILQFKL